MKVKNSLYFKSCPWCQGDLYLDLDRYGLFATCLQCGRIYESQSPSTALVSAGPRRLAA